MVKWRRLSFSLAILLVLAMVVPASAYEKFDQRWSSNKIVWYYDNYIEGAAKNAYASGAGSWNDTKIDASLSFSAAYDVYCATVDNSEVFWDGVSMLAFNPKTNYFVSKDAFVYLNKAMDAWKYTDSLASVACHEFGHVFGLDENGTTRTIMNQYTWGDNSRFETYRLTSPTADDIAGVNSIY
jgi:Matrixin.